MRKLFRFKLGALVKILLLFSCTGSIMAEGLISRAKRNSQANDDGVSTREDQPKINRPGEKWIEIKDISCWESNGKSEEVKSCPKSKIVTGHRFRFLSRTGLTGIQLLCSKKNGTVHSGKEEILEIISKEEAGINLPRGEWENWTKRSHSVFAKGFSFAPGEMNLRRSVKNFDVIYHTENPNPAEVTKQLALTSGKVVTKCPQDHAICGLKMKTDKAGLGILTAIGLKCCFHCVLEEKWEIFHQYNNTGSLDFRGQVNSTVTGQKSLKHIDPVEFSQSISKTKMFARIGKSNFTGFDWTLTANFIWTDETPIAKTYSCKGNSSCVLKQLVGQCGSARVHINKFCKVSNPIGSSASEICTDLVPITSCSDAMEILPSPRSTKQWIYPHGNGNSTKVEVLCDFKVDGGGWTVIQKRSSGPLHDFNREWNEYSNGFGSSDGNFWLGLENVRALTKDGDQELRIQLEDFEGNKTWAKYSNFSISDASDSYRLSVSGFAPDSTAGDSMTNSLYGSGQINNGMRFSTKDNANDLTRSRRTCVEYNGGGGWWFSACGEVSHLNGAYLQNEEDSSRIWKGISWYSWKGESWESLAKTEMKIRKRK